MGEQPLFTQNNSARLFADLQGDLRHGDRGLGAMIMEPVILYRVQDYAGVGPFRHPEIVPKWREDSGDLAMYQTNFDARDYGPINLLHLIRGAAVGTFAFGFRTLEQAFDYFTLEERKRLAALGYQLAMFRADAVLAVTKAQVAFWRRRPLNEGLIGRIRIGPKFSTAERRRITNGAIMG